MKKLLLRHQQRSGLDSRNTHASVLPGPEVVSGVREQSGRADRPGPDVHLPVREIEFTFARIHTAVGQNQLQFAMAQVRLA